MVGIARKNENSAAERLSAPSNIAATMLAPERDTPQFGEIEHDDRENRAELNQHDEAVPEGALAKTEETLHEQHMARRGNRQEFRDALDDAENHRPYCI